MRKQTWLRQLLTVLLLSVLLSLLAGCRTGNGDSERRESDEGYVYTAEFAFLTCENSPEDIIVRENTMYYRAYVYDDQEENGKYQAYAAELDTMESRLLPLAPGENIGGMTVTEDGGYALVVQGKTGSDEGWYLVTADADCTETLRRDVTAVMEEAGSSEGGIYIQAMTAGGDGNICVMTGGMVSTVVVFDSQGQKLYEAGGDRWYEGLCASRDGRVFVCGVDTNSSGNQYVLQEVDSRKKGFGETLKGITCSQGIGVLAAGGENELLISSGNVLYRYDMEKQRTEELLAWLDCDINHQYLAGLAGMEDGRLFAVTHDYTAEAGLQDETVFLTRMPASEVIPKVILTYGTIWLDQEMRGQILQFNKRSTDCRIEVKEYDTGDWAEDVRRLNTDIIAGNGPDLIDLSDLDARVYGESGVLADLYPFLDEDEELAREDFVPNILRELEQEGKLYGIAPSFHILTLMGSTLDLGQRTGWTVEEAQTILAACPEGMELLDGTVSREQMLDLLIRHDPDAYIDWEAGTCSFDSDEFACLLEFAAAYPPAGTIDFDEMEGVYTRVSQGKQLVIEMQLGRVTDYQSYAAMFDGPVACVGYPACDGNGSRLEFGRLLGISAKSEHQNEAWSFLHMLLTEEFQQRVRYDFPVREDVLRQVFDTAMEEKEFYSSQSWEDFTWQEVPATEEEIQQIRRLVDTAKTDSVSDDTVTAIIEEEAAAYFHGQRTARETARIIQSRVQLYVGENK